MSWFGVSCFFERRSADPEAEGLYQESIFLVEALGPEEAVSLASRAAVSEETAFDTMDGTAVEWTFLFAKDAYELLQAPAHKVEVFSRFMDQGAFSALRGHESANAVRPLKRLDPE